MIELKEITEENFDQCISLDPGVENKDFADRTAYSLAEAWLYYPDIRPFCLCLGREPIGFVSIFVGEENFQFINFFIIEDFRNKGYGKEAAKICMAYLTDHYQVERISVPVDMRNLRAQAFWKKLGFEESTTVEDGYVFMRCYL